MGFYDEFGDKLAVSEQKRKARLALEEKLKDSAMRYQNGTFDLEVFDGEGTYARPFKIRITRKNFDEDIIIVHENEGSEGKKAVKAAPLSPREQPLARARLLGLSD